MKQKCTYSDLLIIINIPTKEQNELNKGTAAKILFCLGKIFVKILSERVNYEW